MITFRDIYDWSEVWALLIPIGVLIFSKRKQPKQLVSVVVYVWGAFFLNLAIDIIGDYRRQLPPWLISNNPLYNAHAVFRFICFSWFCYISLNNHYVKIQKILIALFIAFFLFNFIVVENFFDLNHISGNILSAESLVLLSNCMLFYFALLNSNASDYSNRKDFWVVTGLSLYAVINFFLFLFYVPMINENPKLANAMWDFHNLAFIIFCIFIAKAFYVSPRN